MKMITQQDNTKISLGDIVDVVKAACYIVMATRIIIALRKRFG